MTDDNKQNEEIENNPKLDLIINDLQQLDDDANACQNQQQQKLQEKIKLEKIKGWAFIPMLFGKVVSVALPDLASVYDENTCNAWGEAMLPVADKYGWGEPSNSPEVALLVATLPMALPTYFAIKKKIDEPAQIADSAAI